MDIKAVSQLPRVAPADAGRAPVAKSPQSEGRLQIDGAGRPVAGKANDVAARDLAAAIAATQGAEAPRITLIRAELSVDKAAQRVFAQIFDRETGELVQQVPSEARLRLAAATREQLSRLFKTDV